MTGQAEPFLLGFAIAQRQPTVRIDNDYFNQVEPVLVGNDRQAKPCLLGFADNL